MNDLEQTLPAQLHHLADDLAGGPAPRTDPVATAVAARARYRHQRRQRVTVGALALAVAAVVLAVPTTIDALSAPEPGGQVAGPSGTTTAPPSPAPTHDEDEAARAAAAEAARARDEAAAAAQEEAALAARIALVADALAGRDPSLELRAGTDLSCPGQGPVDGAVPAGVGTGLADECRWSAPGLTFALSLTQGQVEEEMVREVDAEVADDGCTVQAMPSTVDVTPLTLCPAGDDDRTVWTLRVPDSGGAGYWVLSAAEEPGAPTDAGAAGLLALVDLAAQQW